MEAAAGVEEAAVAGAAVSVTVDGVLPCRWAFVLFEFDVPCTDMGMGTSRRRRWAIWWLLTKDQ